MMAPEELGLGPVLHVHRAALGGDLSADGGQERAVIGTLGDLLVAKDERVFEEPTLEIAREVRLLGRRVKRKSTPHAMGEKILACTWGA